MLEKIRWIGISIVAVMTTIAYPVSATSAPNENAVVQQLIGRWEKPLTDSSTLAPGGFRFFLMVK